MSSSTLNTIASFCTIISPFISLIVIFPLNELGQWRYALPVVLGVIVGLVWLYEKRKRAGLSIWKPQIKRMGWSKRESKLDDLINEIENFMNRWEQSKFPNSSYKSLMKMCGLAGRKKEIRQHAREILRKIEPLKCLNISQFQSPLGMADWNANRMIALGIESEKIFQTVSTMISKGDNICDSWRRVLEQLENLRSLLL